MKWFKKIKQGLLISKRYPRTAEEAWEKTFEKWELILKARGKNVFHESGSSCGLCNFIDTCYDCPLYEFSGGNQCTKTPYVDWWENKTYENAMDEYMFLLFVREATREDE